MIAERERGAGVVQTCIGLVSALAAKRQHVGLPLIVTALPSSARPVLLLIVNTNICSVRICLE